MDVFGVNLGMRKDGYLLWSYTSPKRRQTHIWTFISSSNTHTNIYKDSSNQLSCELKILQINTLYSNTIGCCVTSSEGKVYTYNKT